MTGGTRVGVVTGVLIDHAVQLPALLLAMDEESYRTAFKGSAMKRAKLAGLQRNASVVLENAS